MLNYRLVPAGDTAIAVEFGDQIDRQLSILVLALARRLQSIPRHGIVETVPTFRSLLVHYDPIIISFAALSEHIRALMQDLPVSNEGARLWRLPACYEPFLGADLDNVASRIELSRTQLIELHCSVTYHVYMLGFLPGQAYMGDLPTELALPRRETPRQKIPAGSIGIANTITCVFPKETPCGWHLIGRSPVPLWLNQPGPRALLAPGDKVVFAPVSLREYEQLSAKVLAGTFATEPDSDRVEVAA